jgi:hypothetical protein
VEKNFEETPCFYAARRRVLLYKNTSLSEQRLPSIFRDVQKDSSVNNLKMQTLYLSEASVPINQFTLQMLLHKTHLTASVHYEQRKIVTRW